MKYTMNNFISHSISRFDEEEGESPPIASPLETALVETLRDVSLFRSKDGKPRSIVDRFACRPPISIPFPARRVEL